MEARAYLDQLLDQGKIIRLTHMDGERRVGQGHAIILDEKLQIAVMIEGCGTSALTEIRPGDLVEFLSLPDAESRIVGPPARIA